MRRADLLIGIVVVAAILFSGIGLATYERGTALIEFDVTYTTNTIDVAAPTPQGIMGSGTIPIDVPIDLDNLTQVKGTITATGGGPRLSSVAIRVTVQGPGVEAQQFSGSLPVGQGSNSAPIPFSVTVRANPNLTTVQAANSADAEKLVVNQTTSTLGKGTWSIRVQFTSGAPAQQVDRESFSARVQVQALRYESIVAVHVTEPGAGAE